MAFHEIKRADAHANRTDCVLFLVGRGSWVLDEIVELNTEYASLKLFFIYLLQSERPRQFFDFHSHYINRFGMLPTL